MGQVLAAAGKPAHRDPKARRVPLVPPVQLALRAHKVRLAPKARKVPQARLAHKARRVPQARLAPKVRRAPPESQHLLPA